MEMYANKFISSTAYSRVTNDVDAQKAMEKNYLYENIRAVSPKEYTNLHLHSAKNSTLKKKQDEMSLLKKKMEHKRRV